MGTRQLVVGAGSSGRARVVIVLELQDPRQVDAHAVGFSARLAAFWVAWQALGRDGGLVYHDGSLGDHLGWLLSAWG